MNCMIRRFEAGLQFLEGISELENHSQLFLKCHSSQSDPVVGAAKALAKD